MIFFKNGEQEGKTSSIWVLVPVVECRGIRKGWGRINMVEMLHIHAWKWKNEKQWNIQERGINENDGGGESNFIVKTFVNVIMNPP
jgi:hypothetical protein